MASARELKQIRALRARKERDRTGTCLVEGIRLVVDAVESGAELLQVIVAPDLLRSELAWRVVRAQEAAGVDIVSLEAGAFTAVATRERPQGIAAVVRQQWASLDVADPSCGLCWVCLAGAQDPGNIGTVLRTCDAVGTAGLMLVEQTADPYDPTAIRASMGAVFWRRLVRTTDQQLAAWVNKSGIHVVGTSDHGAVDYRSLEYRRPLLLLMGSERQGLTGDQQLLCDDLVRIPMVGHVDSLNLGVATGIVLYEVFGRVTSAGSRS